MLKSFILISLVSLSVMAEDEISPEQAKSLHDENCIRCHALSHGDSEHFYTNKDRKINSFKALSSRVNMCKTNLGLQWFDEEVEGVANYLNNDFYKFKK
ncbi:MAG: cytochrome c [Gammaproteobacteria bacterium]|nr:cytochrome c [Gammaproteobacteria bacterium]